MSPRFAAHARTVALAALLLGARAEDAPHTAPLGPPAPAPPAAPSAQTVPLWQSLSDPWEQRLLAELQRPVTLAVADADALAVLRAVSVQCGIAMTFAPGDTCPAKLTLDEHQVPLQALLDRIAVAAGMRYGLRSGAVRWEPVASREENGQSPWTTVDAPMESRWYLLRRATGCSGEEIAALIEMIQRLPDFTNADPAVIVERSGSIVVTQPVAVHDAIDRLIRQSAANPLPERDPPPRVAQRPIRLLINDPVHPPPGDAERRLSEALRRPRDFDLESPTLADFVARFTALTGIRVVAAAEAGDLRRAPQARAIPTRHATLEPRHALDLALDGSGLAASMRVVGGSAWVELTPERTPRELVTRAYRSDWSGFDPSELVDIMCNVEPSVYQVTGASIEVRTDTLQMDDGTEHESTSAQVTCSREAHAHLEERLAVMAAIEAGTDAPPSRKDLPAVVVTVP